jgi:urea transport system substrate-binding protein
VADQDIDESYTPFGHGDYQTIVANIEKFAAGGRTAVVSTINGDSNVPFCKALGNAGLKAKDVPVVAFSVGEEDLRGIDTQPLVGHRAALNHFMPVKNPENDAFIKTYRDWAAKNKVADAAETVTSAPMQATYVGSTCGSRGSRRPSRSRSTRSVRRCTARPSRRPAASR